MKKRMIIGLVILLVSLLVMVAGSPGSIAPILSLIDSGSGMRPARQATDRLAGILLMVEAALTLEYLRRNPIFSE